MAIQDPEGMNLEKGISKEPIKGPPTELPTPVDKPVEEAPVEAKD